MMHVYADKILVLNILIIMSEVKCETSKIQPLTAHEGGSVEIRCPYESRYEGHKKYLCRGKCLYLSQKIIPVKSGSKPNDERFNLTDNPPAHIFTVTITDLRSSDEGTYWCAIVTGIGRTDLYTEVHLKITRDNTSLLTTITTTSKTTTISSTSPASLYRTVNTDTVTPSPPHFYSEPKLKSDRTMIISVSVTLLLLLFGLSLFMYYTQRNNTKDSSPINNDMLQGHTENNIYVITANEEHHNQDSCACSYCVHANNPPPTHSSEADGSIYCLVQLPTNPLA